MAGITARSAKKRVSYHDLHNLSTADLLFDGKKKKRRPASKSLGFFEAERIITSREDSEVKTRSFDRSFTLSLIKFKFIFHDKFLTGKKLNVN